MRAYIPYKIHRHRIHTSCFYKPLFAASPEKYRYIYAVESHQRKNFKLKTVCTLSSNKDGSSPVSLARLAAQEAQGLALLQCRVFKAQKRGDQVRVETLSKLIRGRNMPYKSLAGKATRHR